MAEMSDADARDVRVVVAPYRICPLGAHIDHQVCCKLFSRLDTLVDFLIGNR